MTTDQNDRHRYNRETMDHSWFEEAMPGFALGCLEEHEANRLAGHLVECESCSKELRSHEQTVGMLAFGVPQVEPPDELKDRLLQRIEKRAPVRPALVPKRPRPFASLFQWYSPALAMASFVIIISLSVVNVLQFSQVRRIDTQLSAPLKIIKMRGSDLAPHADGTFVVGPDRLHGVLVASDLPAIAPTQQFQLWLVKNGRKDSGGAFSTTPLGYGVIQVLSPHPLPEYQTAIVTIEPHGGSPSPTTPELMTGAF